MLEVGGTFVAKVLAGGAEQELQALLKKNFTKVANVKPGASRADGSWPAGAAVISSCLSPNT